jgi:SAM-dependent methyltransferase
MSGFSADWLALREPYDRAARNGAVLDAVAAAFLNAPRVTVTDLGCGTGATMRALAPRLPAGQSWRLVDNDEALLQQALREGAATAPPEASVTTVAADLAADLAADVFADLAGAVAPVLADCDLVTTSALLDLVSVAWLDRLVASLTRLSRPFYAALTYDGAVALAPESRHDGEVIAAVNRHQQTDKGFGKALGPDAARIVPEEMRAAGFTVIEGRSDWQFGVDDRAIQIEMLAGWAGAAQEIGVDPAVISQWLGERRDHVAAGRSQMRVGHIDFFATPTGRR